MNIPAELGSIEDDVFDGCPLLGSICVEEGNRRFASPDGVLFDSGMTRLLRYPPAKEGEVFIVPEGISEVCKSAFSGCRLKKVVLPDSVASIGMSAFASCSDLEEVILPKGLKRIGIRVFAGCASLSSIHIPDTVTSIGKEGFKDC
ncbi:MAG: leucine-rich repeat protein, partial [Candidatus Methanomethylophilaceae archaeon]|nr:leucine-rich repeat protein [Candidatus Methanomethylophilaceae archaeon]